MPLDSGELVAIHQLYASYSFASDHGDGDAYAACFTPDGSFDMPGRHLQGADELLASTGAGRDPGAPVGIRHILSNIVVDGEGDKATGRAYVTLVGTAPTGIVMTGEYEDQLQRLDGQWRFSARRFTPDAAPG
ncbi:MAG TPA: nuclear transport factor 2 family protein [Acidimicrobiales bacterium]|jgi:uncharacterized protein (TIGR02246 family)